VTPASPVSHELAGRVAVVTGATSGIGRAIALELAAAGAAVIVHGRDAERAMETLGQIEAAGGDGNVLLSDLSVTEGPPPGPHVALVEQAWDWRGRVDLWVNNAGADVLTGPEADWPFERKLALLWQVDVAATVALSREIGRRMKQSRLSLRERNVVRGANDDNAFRGAKGDTGGAKGDIPSIINIGWDQAEQGMEGDSGQMFGAVKGAVMAFTRSLAQSLAPEVRVNCVAPGWIRTAWGAEASDYWDRRARHESLLDRWGTPEDVARAVRFLASPAAEFITGHVLPVNGGFRYGYREEK
jgi:3-oxoacyl-[acyl-carrier protein] reductase